MGTPQSLHSKALENVLSYIVTFLFSTAIIGSFSYLTFQANADLLAASSSLSTILSRSEQIATGLDLVNVYASGWIATPNTEKMSETIQKMIRLVQEPALTDEDRREFTSYISENQSQLVTEMGKIQGLYVTDDIAKNQKKISLDLYQQFMDVFNELENVVSNWNKSTPEARLDSFKKINGKYTQIIYQMSSLNNSSAALLKYYKEEIDRNANAQKEVENRIHVIRTKSTLSKMGISVGLLVLIGGLIYSYRNARQAGKTNDGRVNPAGNANAETPKE